LPFKPVVAPAAEPISTRAPAFEAPPVVPAGPRLTLEQMASLSVEIAANPPFAAAIRTRYGFDGPGYESEVAAWQRRFAETEGLYARFTEAYEAYSSWLKRAAR
jgi:hypothetical protein